jgi:hypothetical protein
MTRLNKASSHNRPNICLAEPLNLSLWRTPLSVLIRILVA